MTADPDTRLDALETRIAHQDATIEDLNRIVTEQWGAIDLLTRHVAALRERVREMAERPAATGDEPPPPHY
ncbi:protein SlyX [Methylobacterium indicum]|nr:SlyX family protein [Methylobacterium indicum]KMO13808.1 protein SlyX [Methylobacterium indicum]KMO13861.1 protein SlyX [Methylobacterium indicum]KTS25009.1 protein SlyX [Methylobacterium indicum]KTS25887.1 protein SlyX [Methylobacterium indicum]KTS53857.1 protein SlyX [Methylobacterium indicum]